MYLHAPTEDTALTPKQKKENKVTLALATEIVAQRNAALKYLAHGMPDPTKQKMSLAHYLGILAEKRRGSSGNFGNWDSMIKHLAKFEKKPISLCDIDKEWIENFREYLTKHARTKSNQPLSQNSQCSYFNKIRAALKCAVKDGILMRNPAQHVDGIKPGEPDREYLTIEEIKSISKVPCDIPILKQAFLFSCFTGLRWSDIHKLTWSEIRHDDNNGYHIRYTQQKTGSIELLNINDTALQFLPTTRKDDADRVFQGLKYSAHYNLKLQQWVLRAGVSKTITFHCARHSYATLLLANGVDIYTVQKMLGHKHITTTSIYAKVMDIQKKEASSRINFDLTA